jgi:hypothetical protein
MGLVQYLGADLETARVHQSNWRFSSGWPLATNAQVHTRRVAALVGTGNDALGQSWITAFRQKLRDLGWSDRDIQIEVIWGGGDIEPFERVRLI